MVNYASGRPHWLERQDKEAAVLTKYKERGYSVHTSCRKLHGPGRSCHVCTQQLRRSTDEIESMTFQPADTFHPGPDYLWMLGAYAPNKVKADDSASLVIVEGKEGDDVFDGIYGELEHLCKRKVKKIFAKFGY